MTNIILLLFWLLSARIPPELWQEYVVVAQCESRLDYLAVGDNGSAKGLMQIHYDLWLPWAIKQDSEFVNNKWENPIDNLKLAYIIQENYSIPRHQDRWHQWSAKPNFDC